MKFRSETFDAVKMLYVLGDCKYHCGNTILNNESKSFI
jgi:hypothetical protein